MAKLHPFFDPASRYGRFSASIAETTKRESYFRYLEDEIAAKPLRIQPKVLMETTGRLAAAVAIRELIALGDPIRSPRARFTIGIGSGTLGSPSRALEVEVRIKYHEDWPTVPTRCAMLLIEPHVLNDLAGKVGDLSNSAEPPAAMLLKMFAVEIFGNFDISRLLSSLPKAEGIVDPDKGTARFIFPFPESSPLEGLPERVHVIAVMDQPLAS